MRLRFKTVDGAVTLLNNGLRINQKIAKLIMLIPVTKAGSGYDSFIFPTTSFV
ncbi:hypothetical protein D3C80_920610 [compost metagenome]